MTTTQTTATTPTTPTTHRARRPRLTRRGFLIASGVVGAVGVGGSAAWATLADAAGTRDPQAAGGTLVLITLYGGNDGLDTVIPATDPAYQKARGDLAIAADKALPLAQGLSFHPALQRLKRRYDGGDVAIVRGVGYPRPDHSHFRSMAIWQTASPQTPTASGWLGRWLDTTGTSPIQAVGIGATLTPALVGAKRSAAAVPVGTLAVPAGALGQSIRSLYKPRAADTGSLLEEVAGVDADYLSVADRLGPLLKESSTANEPSETGKSDGSDGSDLGSQLTVVSRLINAGVPTSAYAVSLGGFDTHAGEQPTHARLMGELDSAVDAFLSSVARSPHAQRLVVMIYSEFGRRVATNASGGTDHGTAAPVILVGPGVRGGMYGDQPSLTRLGTGDDDGDLVVTTDFRDVYATVLDGVLQGDSAAVLGPGRRALGFIRT